MKPANNQPDTNKHSALAAQIKATERQIIDRQQRVDKDAARLVNDLHQQITTPATLLLAGGAGFMVGELTYRPPKTAQCHTQSTTAANSDANSSPLTRAVSFMSLAHTLYQLLPLVLIMDTFCPVDNIKDDPSS